MIYDTAGCETAGGRELHARITSKIWELCCCSEEKKLASAPPGLRDLTGRGPDIRMDARQLITVMCCRTMDKHDDQDYDRKTRGELLLAKERLQGKTCDGGRARSEPTAPYCSFCGKARNEVEDMVSGPTAHSRNGVWICCECVEIAKQIMDERASNA